MRPLLHHTAETGWVNDPLYAHLPRRHVPPVLPVRPGQDDLGPRVPLGPRPQPGPAHVDGAAGGAGAGRRGRRLLVRLARGRGRLLHLGRRADAPDIGRVRRAVPTDDTWTTWTQAGHGRHRAARGDPLPRPVRPPRRRHLAHGGGRGDRGRPGPVVLPLRGPPHLAPRGRRGPPVAGARRRVDRHRPGSARRSWRSAAARCWWSARGSRARSSTWPTPSAHRTVPSCIPGPWHRLSHGPVAVRRVRVPRRGGPAGARGLAARGLRRRGGLGRRDQPPRPGLVARATDSSCGHPRDCRRGPTGPGRPALGDVVEEATFALTAREGSILVTSGPRTPSSCPWAGGPLHLVVDSGVLEVYGEHGWAAVPTAAYLTRVNFVASMAP